MDDLDTVYLVQHNYNWYPFTYKVFRTREDAEHYKSRKGDSEEYWHVVEFKVH